MRRFAVLVLIATPALAACATAPAPQASLHDACVFIASPEPRTVTPDDRLPTGDMRIGNMYVPFRVANGATRIARRTASPSCNIG